jgi:8-oxo-dGTP diphosphatase
MHRKAADERVSFFVVARAWRGEPVNAEPDKCHDLAWYPLDRLPAGTVPYVRRALDNYRRGVWFDSFGWD